MTSKSYFVKYWTATPGRCLLGGITRGQSCRYGRRADAETRMATVLELNGDHCRAEISECNLAPEIFPHCGHIAQAIGGRCFGCGKVLTKDDAVQFCSDVEVR